MHTSNRTQHDALQALMRPEGSSDSRSSDSSQSNPQQEQKGQKRPLEKDEEEDDQAHDEVRLWEDGFKDRYYESKFDVPPDNLEFR